MLHLIHKSGSPWFYEGSRSCWITGEPMPNFFQHHRDRLCWHLWKLLTRLDYSDVFHVWPTNISAAIIIIIFTKYVQWIMIVAMAWFYSLYWCSNIQVDNNRFWLHWSPVVVGVDWCIHKYPLADNVRNDRVCGLRPQGSRWLMLRPFIWL